MAVRGGGIVNRTGGSPDSARAVPTASKSSLSPKKERMGLVRQKGRCLRLSADEKAKEGWGKRGKPIIKGSGRRGGQLRRERCEFFNLTAGAVR